MAGTEQVDGAGARMDHAAGARDIQRWADFPCKRSSYALNSYGYAVRTANARRGRSVYLHITEREDFYGKRLDTASNMTLDHRCRNTWCIEPRHQEECTRGENQARANEREVCKRGHFKGARKRCQRCKRITARDRRAVYGRRDRGASYPDLRFGSAS